MATQYHDIFKTAQSDLRQAPEKALVAFEADSRQVAGLLSEVAVRGFRFQIDEPEALGGSDRAPNPVEYVLAALAGCQEITYRLYADALGIPLDGVSVKVEGTIDLRGLFDADESVRPGFRDIRATVRLESAASVDELRRLKAAVDGHCPVLDLLRNLTPVRTDLAGIEEKRVSDAA